MEALSPSAGQNLFFVPGEILHDLGVTKSRKKRQAFTP
jgi:hypothetical protein